MLVSQRGILSSVKLVAYFNTSNVLVSLPNPRHYTDCCALFQYIKCVGFSHPQRKSPCQPPAFQYIKCVGFSSTSVWYYYIRADFNTSNVLVSRQAITPRTYRPKHFNTSNVLVSRIKASSTASKVAYFNTSNVLVSLYNGGSFYMQEPNFNTSNVLVSPGDKPLQAKVEVHFNTSNVLVSLSATV